MTALDDALRPFEERAAHSVGGCRYCYGTGLAECWNTHTACICEYSEPCPVCAGGVTRLTAAIRAVTDDATVTAIAEAIHAERCCDKDDPAAWGFYLDHATVARDAVVRVLVERLGGAE